MKRFNNGPCSGGSGKNGTCYTAEECETKGGINSGTCAAGYGVCCTCKLIFYKLNQRSKFFYFSVILRCGDKSNENCTYFESTGSELGACSLKVCRCDSSVCQVNIFFLLSGFKILNVF